MKKSSVSIRTEKRVCSIAKKAKLPADVLKRLTADIFDDCSSVTLSAFAERGFSGAILLAAQGIKSVGPESIPCVVKLAKPSSDIEREFRNYKRFVAHTIEHDRIPIVYGNRPTYQGEWGGIAYSLIGGGRSMPCQFAELYSTADALELCVILNSLFNTLMRPWIESRRLRGSAWPRQEKELPETWYDVCRINPAKASKIRQALGRLPEECKHLVARYADPIECCRGIGVECLPPNTVLAITHGDLNSANILFSETQNFPWLIDFAHTGYGHYLRDLARLEVEIKFMLMDKGHKREQDRLRKWTAMDIALDVVPFGSASDLPVSVYDNMDPELLKAYCVIRHLRILACDRMIGNRVVHIMQYRIMLLLYTLQTLVFADVSEYRKVFAYWSASRLCKFKLRGDR